MKHVANAKDGGFLLIWQLSGKKAMTRLKNVLLVAALELYRLKKVVKKKLWFSPETIREALSRSAASAGTTANVDVKIAEKKRQVEREILEKGEAICDFCEEVIFHHPEMSSAGWVWESEEMLGWCEKANGSKHRPRITIEEEGESHAEPI